MLTLSSIINKTCLLGLTYFSAEGEISKQSLLAGTVVSQQSEQGICIRLTSGTSADFLIPNDLSCWFTAPKGDFYTSVEGVTVSDPDYLVTWDIYQTKKSTGSGRDDNEQQEMQWWEWKPRVLQPKVG